MRGSRISAEAALDAGVTWWCSRCLWWPARGYEGPECPACGAAAMVPGDVMEANERMVDHGPRNGYLDSPLPLPS